MIEHFLFGLACGILLTIVMAPFLVKRYIRKKINEFTGGLLRQ